MIDEEINNLTEQQSKEVLSKLLKAYLTPAFGALPKNEIELLVLNALVDVKYVTKDPEVYELVSKLKITRSKARNLIYERELRRSSSKELDAKIKDLLKKPILQKDGKNFILEVENPLVLDHLKAKVKKLGYISDVSFSPSVVKLSIDATVSLVEAYLEDSIKDKAQKKLIKAGAPDKSLTGILKASIIKLASKIASDAGESAIENISDYITPVIDSPLETLKESIKILYESK